MPVASNIRHYAEIVRGTFEKREIAVGAKRIFDEASNGQSTEALADMLHGLGDRFAAPERYTALDLRKVIAEAAPAQRFLFAGTIPAGGLVGLVAQGGLGKTFLILVLAISGAIGRTLLSSFHPARPIKTLYFASEDSCDEIHRRIRAIISHYEIDDEGGLARIIQNIRVYPGSSFPMASQGKDGVVRPTADWRRVQREVEEFGADLVVFDPLAHYVGIDENSNVEMAAAMNAFRELIPNGGDRSIILVHHTSKARQDETGSSASRGASAFRDSIRCGFGLAPLTTKEVKRYGIQETWRFVRLENSKMNWGERRSGAVYFERMDGGVLEEVDLAGRGERVKAAMLGKVAVSLAKLIGDNSDDLTMTAITKEVEGKAIRDALKERHGEFVTGSSIREAYQRSIDMGLIALEKDTSKCAPRYIPRQTEKGGKERKIAPFQMD